MESLTQNHRNITVMLVPNVGAIAIATVALLFWGYGINYDFFSLALTILLWFYLSVITAGLTMLYASHQRKVKISYFISLGLFLLIISFSGLQFLYALILAVMIGVYFLTLGLFHKLIVPEVWKAHAVIISGRDLALLLLPVFFSFGVVVGTLVGTFVQSENIFLFGTYNATVNPAMMKLAWLLPLSSICTIILGLLLGLLSRLFWSGIVIATLSICSVVLFLTLLEIQPMWTWLLLFGGFFLSFACGRLGRFWYHKSHT